MQGSLGHKCGLLLACVIITTVSCERRHEYREFSVVRALVTINRAESEFFKKCRRYASLSELGPTGMSLVSQELASGVFREYRVEVTVRDSSYELVAYPIAPGLGGRRSFYTDQSGVLRQSWGPDRATSASEVIK